jgi:hypothetical protein
MAEDRKFFDPEKSWEDAQTLTEADKLITAMEYRQRQMMQQGSQQWHVETLQSSLEKAGLTQQDWQKLIAENPDIYGEEYARVYPKGTDELIQGVKARVEVKRRGGKLVSRGVQPSQPDSQRQADIIEARRTGKMSSDDALAALVADAVKGMF